MKILAFDTSTDTLSVAVGTGSGAHAAVWQHTGPGGAQASATLIPVILRLLREAGLVLADLDALAFGRGPGSFTGLRTACAVAQGLGFGAAQVQVLPVDTLLALAEEARHTSGARQLVALLDARMGEVYTARYDFDSANVLTHQQYAVTAPGNVFAEAPWALAGNAFAAYGDAASALGDRLPAGVPRIAALPTASAMLRLAPALLSVGHAVPADQAAPLYIRDKVAFTTDERLAMAAKTQTAVTPPTPP